MQHCACRLHKLVLLVMFYAKRQWCDIVPSQLRGIDQCKHGVDQCKPIFCTICTIFCNDLIKWQRMYRWAGEPTKLCLWNHNKMRPRTVCPRRP